MLTDFGQSLWRVATTPGYLLINLSDLCTTYLVTGVISQLPRYLEIHFHQPAYVANILSGMETLIVEIGGEYKNVVHVPLLAMNILTY